MEEKIIRLLADYLKMDPAAIGPDSDLIADLKVNSLDLVEMVCICEMEFGCTIPERDIRKFRRVKDIAAYLEAKTR